MEYVTLKNININNTLINYTFEKGNVYGIYSKDEKVREELLLVLNGINPNNGIVLQNSKNVFDNKYFFLQRIYIDFSGTYLKTLKSPIIKETFVNKYQIPFDEKTFDSYIKVLGARNQAVVTSEYKFSKLGTTLVNFALLKSLTIPSYTVNNPTINLTNQPMIDLFVRELTKKNSYDTIIFGLNKISDFERSDGKNVLDKIIILSDYNSYYVIDPIIDSFLIIEDNLFLHNKLFKTKNNMVICLNNFSKDELKKFNANKIKYFKKTVFEIEQFME